jgi:hypothetical protein
VVITEEKALRVYAVMMNTLNYGALVPYLADNFVYESQYVFTPLQSKVEFAKYIRAKLETVRAAGATVYAEMGIVDVCGENRNCVILAQDTPSNLVALVLAKVEGRKISRLDLCVVPSPRSASRSGEYPGQSPNNSLKADHPDGRRP